MSAYANPVASVHANVYADVHNTVLSNVHTCTCIVLTVTTPVEMRAYSQQKMQRDALVHARLCNGHGAEASLP